MPKATRIAPSPSGSNSPYQTFPPPPSGESSSSRGRHRARVYTLKACQNCQIKKTKCSGQPPPCARCAGEEVECVFNQASTSRRREASARKESEIHKTRDCLERLLTLLGSTEEQKLGRVREMIRNGIQWEGIHEVLENTDLAEAEESVVDQDVQSSSSSKDKENFRRVSKTPVAFDEWIAELFGSAEQENDPTGTG